MGVVLDIVVESLGFAFAKGRIFLTKLFPDLPGVMQKLGLRDFFIDTHMTFKISTPYYTPVVDGGVCGQNLRRRSAYLPALN